MQKSVVFLFPHLRISGGNKILTTYARGLVGEGWNVTALSLHKRFLTYGKLGVIADAILKFGENFLQRNSLGSGIVVTRKRFVSKSDLKRYDLIVVTNWAHSVNLAELRIDPLRVLYLCQHDESLYHASKQDRQKAISSYRNDFKKMAVSTWLANRIRAYGGEAEVLSNPLGDNFFVPARALRDRPFRLGLLVHPADWKGSKMAFRAGQLVKQRFPTIEIIGFGAHGNCGLDLDDFVDKPDEKQVAELLRSCLVFLSASEYEGFGLPAAEAMASGALLVTTDNGGVNDFAVHRSSALISYDRSENALASLVEWALDNIEDAELIAAKGVESVNLLRQKLQVSRFVQRVEALTC